MYYILNQDEYDELCQASGKIELFRDSVKHELQLKRNDIDTYSQIEDNKDCVNLMKHEYSGMILVREIFEKIMRGE